MARAVLEGTAFAMRDVIDRLNRMNVETRSIMLLGGGAKSRTWAKIRADLTGLPLDLPKITDTAPIGSAMLAAVATGIQPDLISAAKCVGDISERILPDRGLKSVFDEAYNKYRRLFKCLRPMFNLS
jgi:xylulokinase